MLLATSNDIAIKETSTTTPIMDLTDLFKETVKTIGQRDDTLAIPDKTRILKSKPRDEFIIKAKDIRHQLTQLRDLLNENRVAYMRLGCHLKATAQMTDEERDIIDEESEKILSICNLYIKDLKVLNGKKIGKQMAQHMQGVLDVLTSYLQTVFQIHNEQRTCRVQHELDTYKLLKLESNKKLIPVVPPRERVRPRLIEEKTPIESREVTDDSDDGYEDDDMMDQPKKHSKSLLEVALDEDTATASKFALEEETFSAEDVQMFESENSHLYNELKGLSEEVEQIEKNVFGIAKLQEIFTEKVNCL